MDTHAFPESRFSVERKDSQRGQRQDEISPSAGGRGKRQEMKAGVSEYLIHKLPLTYLVEGWIETKIRQAFKVNGNFEFNREKSRMQRLSFPHKIIYKGLSG